MTRKPGVLQFRGSQRVRQDWATEQLTAACTTHTPKKATCYLSQKGFWKQCRKGWILSRGAIWPPWKKLRQKGSPSRYEAWWAEVGRLRVCCQEWASVHMLPCFPSTLSSPTLAFTSVWLWPCYNSLSSLAAAWMNCRGLTSALQDKCSLPYSPHLALFSELPRNPLWSQSSQASLGAWTQTSNTLGMMDSS